MGDLGSLPIVVAWTGWLLTYLLHSTVLIGSTWIVLRVTRLRPATRDVLWKTALIGGLVTATATALPMRSKGPVSITEVAGEVIAPEPGITAQPGITAEPGIAARAGIIAQSDIIAQSGIIHSNRMPAMTWVPERADATTAIAVSARLVDPSPRCLAAVRAGRPGDARWLSRLEGACASAAAGTWWPLGLISLWLLGATVGVVSLCIRRRSLTSIYGSLQECGPRARLLLDGLIADSGGGGRLSRVRLRASSLVGTPCVLPGDTLVLSPRCERELTDAELRAVLAHELAHVARRDVFWSGFARLTASVFWLQPLNRWVCDRLSHTSELVCDEWAVGVTGERYGLASSISRVAEWALPSQPMVYGVSMAGRRGRGLADRVGRILHDPCLRREPRWMGTALAMLLLAPLYWLPAFGAPVASATFVVEEFNVVHVDAETELRPVQRQHLQLPVEVPEGARLIIVRRSASD